MGTHWEQKHSLNSFIVLCSHALEFFLAKNFCNTYLCMLMVLHEHCGYPLQGVAQWPQMLHNVVHGHLEFDPKNSWGSLARFLSLPSTPHWEQCFITKKDIYC
jgi:hypothetical protein